MDNDRVGSNVEAGIVAEATLKARAYREVSFEADWTPHDVLIQRELPQGLTRALTETLLMELKPLGEAYQRFALALADGDTLTEAALIAGISRRQAREWVVRIRGVLRGWRYDQPRDRFSAHLLEQVRREDERRHAPRPLRHCPAGREKCRNTGICPYAR